MNPEQEHWYPPGYGLVWTGWWNGYQPFHYMASMNPELWDFLCRADTIEVLSTYYDDPVFHRAFSERWIILYFPEHSVAELTWHYGDDL